MISLDRYKTIIKYILLKKGNMDEKTRIEDPPHGKSLQIYWYLLTHGPMGIRNTLSKKRSNQGFWVFICELGIG
ncbi:MAG: hypothetical protein ACW99Q_29770 [Candidatus Kariarchaeaceae archaeon]|jgi:hypothetical protein